MLERDIEAELVKRVRSRGGWCVKWSAPGAAGVPDRIIFMPSGRVALVETKRPGARLRPLQAAVRSRLAELGQVVQVIDSLEGVDCFIEGLCR